MEIKKAKTNNPQTNNTETNNTQDNIDLNEELEKIRKLNFLQAENIEKWLKIYFSSAINENSNNRYEKMLPNISRGQILAVNFGYGIQSEFRNFHYCAALHDSPRKTSKITVIPITSKEHPHQIDIGYEMADSLETIIRDKERSAFWKPYRELEEQYKGITDIKFGTPAIGSYSTVYPNCTAHIKNLQIEFKLLSERLNTLDAEATLNKLLLNLKEFDDFLNSSPKLLKHSYLRVDDITTISKARIVSPKNLKHPLYKLKLSNETLNKIDSEIIRRFTNYDLSNK